MDNNFYLTTAIDYTNDVIHIGHAYQKILADALIRYHRTLGERVFFLTGAVLSHCFRRGGILAGVVTVAASLKILGAFSALNFGLLLLSAFFAEVYFMQKQ